MPTLYACSRQVRTWFRSVSYHFPQLRGSAHVERLLAACRKGNASLHGTGINPGFMLERIGVTLTGLCNRIEHMTMKELVDCSRVQSAAILAAVGFGGPPQALAPGSAAHAITEAFYRSALQLTSQMLFGSRLDRIEHETLHTLATQDMSIGAITIARGTVATIMHRLTGYLEDRPRLTLEEHWYQGKETCPVAGIDTGEHYIFDIEAEPCSIHMEMSYTSSLKTRADRYAGDPSVPSTYATVVPMIQAIAPVVEAAPGIVFATVWSHHAKDFRVRSLT